MPFPLLQPIEPVTLPGGVEMAFQVIPPGAVQEDALRTGEPLSYLMGSRGNQNNEEPRHRVIIPAPFLLGTTPVTQAQFAAWTDSEHYADWREQNGEEPHENHFVGNPDHSAENLSWNEARAFCDWLNRGGWLPAGLQARLPWEAEWEYACRAGTTTEYWNGDGEAALREVGWFGEEWKKGSTHPVAQLAANPWGLYDMHGNVWEWCADAYDSNAYARRADGWIAEAWATDDKDPNRVFRGGSWFNTARGCRSAFRFGRHPRNRNWYLGFRVLLGSPGPVAEPGTGGSGGREGARVRDERAGDRKAGARGLAGLRLPRGKGETRIGTDGKEKTRIRTD
ncbi:MAG: formylglycine-generating enzyme family protein [Verrucomicrobiales bacterium]|nr:formylglycine-generating enzyme family protein [Verrucomicrobiales bacterium]